MLVHRKPCLTSISVYYISDGVCRKRTWLSEDDVRVELAFSRLPLVLFHPQHHVPIEASGSMTDLSMHPLWPTLIFC